MRFRFYFVVFCFTAFLIITIYLRTSNNYIFYRLYTLNAQQGRLKQQLGGKQLRLEALINPAAITEYFG